VLIVFLGVAIIEFDFKANFFESMGNDERGDLFVVTDRDGLIDKTDVDVCGGDTELIVQRRFDGKDTTWAV